MLSLLVRHADSIHTFTVHDLLSTLSGKARYIIIFYFLGTQMPFSSMACVHAHTD